MTATIHLCFGPDIWPDRAECVNCGGSADRRHMPGRVDSTDYGGPWCSIECHDEYIDWTTREREAREAQVRCCDVCGFDRSEHAAECPNLSPRALAAQMAATFSWMTRPSRHPRTVG